LGLELALNWVCPAPNVRYKKPIWCGICASLRIGFVLGLFGFELALNWVCFFGVCEGIYFHNPLCNLDLRSFGHLANWVCFA